mmetsp:Transcript_45510/g.117686  ORF Transcript_45510/g.117686 Transcript_45510/m.117686 type:complete len:299 (+) Transcript_45510:77-973(+)
MRSLARCCLLAAAAATCPAWCRDAPGLQLCETTRGLREDGASVADCQALLAHVRPSHLEEPQDYVMLLQSRRPVAMSSRAEGDSGTMPLHSEGSPHEGAAGVPPLAPLAEHGLGPNASNATVLAVMDVAEAHGVGQNESKATVVAATVVAEARTVPLNATASASASATGSAPAPAAAARTLHHALESFLDEVADAAAASAEPNGTAGAHHHNATEAALPLLRAKPQPEPSSDFTLGEVVRAVAAIAAETTAAVGDGIEGGSTAQNGSDAQGDQVEESVLTPAALGAAVGVVVGAAVGV